MHTPRMLTIPDLPDAVIPGRTQFGRDITNERWHCCESERRAAKGERIFVKTNGGGRIHLCPGDPIPERDRVYYMPGGAA